VLPSPPGAELLIGPDRRRHFIRYRYIRMPSAILGLAEELGPPPGSGYRVEAHCNHFADARVLEPELRARMRAAIGQQHLEQKDGA
jgi:hypothetical protein